MSVYFITCREIGMVKIGCAYDPFKRMATLQTAFPLDLALDAVFQGAYEREKEFHKQFAEHRVRGEWFKLCPEIEALIDASEPPQRPRSVSQKKKLWALHEEETWRERRAARRPSADETKYAAAMKETLDEAEKAFRASQRSLPLPTPQPQEIAA